MRILASAFVPGILLIACASTPPPPPRPPAPAAVPATVFVTSAEIQTTACERVGGKCVGLTELHEEPCPTGFYRRDYVNRIEGDEEKRIAMCPAVSTGAETCCMPSR